MDAALNEGLHLRIDCDYGVRAEYDFIRIDGVSYIPDSYCNLPVLDNLNLMCLRTALPPLLGRLMRKINSHSADCWASQAQYWGCVLRVSQ